MFFLGISWGKNMCCYILVSETCPKRTHLYISTIVFNLDNAIPLIIAPLYFYLGGKNWKDLYILALVIPVISFILSLFLPESPRYLFSRKKYVEFDKTMKHIARFNKVQYNIFLAESATYDLDNAALIPNINSPAKDIEKEYSI